MKRKNKNLLVLALLFMLVTAFYFITIFRIKSGI
jgi:signal peptidase I